MKKYTPKHKKPGKVKNATLTTINYLMGIIALISAAAIDKEPFYITIPLLVVSVGWLCLVGWANGYLKFK